MTIQNKTILLKKLNIQKMTNINKHTTFIYSLHLHLVFNLHNDFIYYFVSRPIRSTRRAPIGNTIIWNWRGTARGGRKILPIRTEPIDSHTAPHFIIYFHLYLSIDISMSFLISLYNYIANQNNNVYFYILYKQIIQILYQNHHIKIFDQYF